MTDAELERAWDALVQSVIDAKAARPAALAALVDAQKEEGRLLAAMQPYSWRAEPVPPPLLADLEQARSLVARTQQQWAAVEQRVVEAQAAMKAGVS